MPTKLHQSSGAGRVSQGNLLNGKSVVFYINLMVYVVCLEVRLEGNETKIKQHSCVVFDKLTS